MTFGTSHSPFQTRGTPEAPLDAPSIQMHAPETHTSHAASPSASLAQEEAHRKLVRAGFRFLLSTPGFSPELARGLGRALGREATSGTLADHLDAFGELGRGTIRLGSIDGVHYVFEGDGLHAHADASCAFAQGFLEGSVEALEGAPTLATSSRCHAAEGRRCMFALLAGAP